MSHIEKGEDFPITAAQQAAAELGIELVGLPEKADDEQLRRAHALGTAKYVIPAGDINTSGPADIYSGDVPFPAYDVVDADGFPEGSEKGGIQRRSIAGLAGVPALKSLTGLMHPFKLDPMGVLRRPRYEYIEELPVTGTGYDYPERHFMDRLGEPEDVTIRQETINYRIPELPQAEQPQPEQEQGEQ